MLAIQFAYYFGHVHSRCFCVAASAGVLMYLQGLILVQFHQTRTGVHVTNSVQTASDLVTHCW